MPQTDSKNLSLSASSEGCRAMTIARRRRLWRDVTLDQTRQTDADKRMGWSSLEAQHLDDQQDSKKGTYCPAKCSKAFLCWRDNWFTARHTPELTADIDGRRIIVTEDTRGNYILVASSVCGSSKRECGLLPKQRCTVAAIRTAFSFNIHGFHAI